MKTFFIEIEGTTPLLQHRMSEETLFGLLGAKGGKTKIKEERTPRQIAEQHAHQVHGKFVIPTVSFVGAFSHTASDYKQKNSVRRSYKTIAAGIFQPLEEFATIVDNKYKAVGNFEVDVRRGNNAQRGAIVVCRPRFDSWRTTFHVELDDQLIASETALDILNDAGRRCGVGSFRVSKGGRFGQFRVVEWKEVKNKQRRAE